MKSVKIEIDSDSGFCFGVKKAIETAEKELAINGNLFCLGDIVHNDMEMDRLQKEGMVSIATDDIKKIKSNKIFIRAHGEPPHTYKLAKDNHLEVIDATCPVVLKLQKRIKQSWEILEPRNGQVIIYGKKGHAEVIGLKGQTNNNALIIESFNEIDQIDLNRSIHLYAQTTKSIEGFKKISQYIATHIKEGVEFKSFDTICRQVANRLPKMNSFAVKHDIIVFVGGAKSSNAKMLFDECKKVNPDSYFISSPDQLEPTWFATQPDSIGICGATSTPPWLMQRIATEIEIILKVK